MAAPRILSFAPFGLFRVHHQLDAVVGTSLRLRGAEFALVGCDGIYKNCDVLAHSGDNWERDCAACTNAGRQFFGQFQIPTFQLRQCLQLSDWEEARQWASTIAESDYQNASFQGYPIGDWVISSIFSLFRITHDGLSDPEVIKVFHQYLINGFVTIRAMTRIIQQYQPTGMLVFNGRYAPYRIALELGKLVNIPVVTHERGYADDTFFLFENYSAIQNQPTRDCYQYWKDIPLKETELQRVSDYMNNREAGRDSNFTPFVTYTTEYDEARYRLRIPDGKRIFVVFTSSEYEVAYCDDFKTPLPQLEVIQRLIDVFRDRDDYLVIRHHPYLAGNPSSQPDRIFLNKVFRDSASLPHNVRLIMPSEEMSSYALFWIADGAISFFSSTGLEGLFRGLPMACFEQSRFRDGIPFHLKDFSPDGLSTLVDTLLDYRAQFGVHDLQRLFRFQYAVIGRLSLKFKSFGFKDTFDFDLRFQSTDQLLPGHDEILDRLCNHFLLGSSLHSTPTSADRDIDASGESQTLSNQLQAIRQFRTDLDLRAQRFRSTRIEPKLCVIPIQSTSIATSPSFDWIQHSRHKNISFTEGTPSSYDQYSDLLSKLKKVVEKCSDEYCVIADSRVSYTECFASHGIDTLMEEKHRELSGVCFGMWFVDNQQEIITGLFSKRSPGTSFELAKAHYPPGLEMPILLSRVLFRTSRLLDLLNSLQSYPQDNESLTRGLFDILNSGQFFCTVAQSVVVRS
ncbi:MAG: hypothetical protein KDD70_04280 [Bdellovibrionales bacterium]|nr:hypothetical protein [Bdellovibrionales bacterium]